MVSGKQSFLKRHRLVPEGKLTVAEMLRLGNRWVHFVVLCIAQFALALMTLLVFITVVLRYCFGTGIGWAEEVPTLLVTLFAFIACAIGVRDHLHISVNIVYNLFPKGGKGRKFFAFFGDVCVLLCGVFLFVCGIQYVGRLLSRPGVLPMTGWPTWVQYIPAPIAGFLMTFDSILFLTGILKKDDTYYSEKEIDYREELKNQKKQEASK
ncbi:MAG: TRAP transporter small permease [Spirochaetaceae bacterium]|nr:TRAP transporter small permease [Spirochaetaceae bacterium]